MTQLTYLARALASGFTEATLHLGAIRGSLGTLVRTPVSLVRTAGSLVRTAGSLVRTAGLLVRTTGSLVDLMELLPGAGLPPDDLNRDTRFVAGLRVKPGEPNAALEMELSRLITIMFI